MQVVHRQPLADGRVNNGEIGVAAGSDDALAGVHTQQPGGIGGRDVGVLRQGHPPFHHRLRVVHAHSYLNADVAAANVLHIPAGGFVQIGGKAAVGGGKGQVAPQQPGPQVAAVLRVLQRRVGMILHPVRFPVLPGVERQGQGQHFAINRLPPAAGGRHRVHPVAGGDMNEVHPRSVLPGDADGVAKRQILHLLGMHQVDIVPVPNAPLLRQQVVVHHNFVILGVHRQDAVIARQLRRQVGQPPVVNAPDGRQRQRRIRRRAYVGGKDFHAGKIVVDELAHPRDAVRRIAAGVNDVRRVVGISIPFPHGEKVQHAAHQFALIRRRRKVHHGGRPAPDGAQRMLQRPGVGRSGHQLMRAGPHIGGGVNVRFNAAGRNDAPRRVHRPRRFVAQGARRADGHDAPVLHADVHHSGLAGHNNDAAGNQQVQHS